MVVRAILRWYCSSLLRPIVVVGASLSIPNLGCRVMLGAVSGAFLSSECERAVVLLGVSKALMTMRSTTVLPSFIEIGGLFTEVTDGVTRMFTCMSRSFEVFHEILSTKYPTPCCSWLVVKTVSVLSGVVRRRVCLSVPNTRMYPVCSNNRPRLVNYSRATGVYY